MEGLGRDVIRQILSYLGAESILTLYCTAKLFHVMDENVIVNLRKKVAIAKDYAEKFAWMSGVEFFLKEKDLPYILRMDFIYALLYMGHGIEDPSMLFLRKFIDQDYDDFPQTVLDICGFEYLPYAMAYTIIYNEGTEFDMLLKNAKERMILKKFNDVVYRAKEMYAKMQRAYRNPTTSDLSCYIQYVLHEHTCTVVGKLLNLN